MKKRITRSSFIMKNEQEHNLNNGMMPALNTKAVDKVSYDFHNLDYNFTQPFIHLKKFSLW